MKGTSVCKWVIFCGLLGLAVICLTFILLNQWNGNPLKRRILSILAPGCLSEVSENVELMEDVDARLAEELTQAVDLERKIIRQDMKDYQYPNGTYDISARKLEDLLIEENGKPIRNVILTTWRSGSNFFSGIINAHPATFFHQEPLQDFEIGQIRGPPLDADAVKRLRALFECKFADLDEYTDFLKAKSWALDYNTHVSKRCKAHKDLCYNHKFLSTICKLFPFQLMKIVRLSLSVAQELLTDEKLAVRMVLLVRDPRGALQSRRHRDWCVLSRDCIDPALLCADLVSDYKVAVELLKKYPNKFKVIRYEDLVAEPYESVMEVSEFYGLDFHHDMKVFLDTHTNRDEGGEYSTFRDSKKAPYRWRTELKFEDVKEIQQSCGIAMKHWGYVPALNATHQREFNPVTNYVLN